MHSRGFAKYMVAITHSGSSIYSVTEEMVNLMSVGVTLRGQSWYAKRVRQGMNIFNVESFLEVCCFMCYYVPCKAKVSVQPVFAERTSKLMSA